MLNGSGIEMAEGELKVELDKDLSEKVRTFAIATGARVESVVREAVADYVSDWSETLARLAEHDRTGESVDAEEALARFRDAVASRDRSRA